MPTGPEDCLCRDCLRQMAANQFPKTGSERWTIGAVLLDMDGTLLDTERVYHESLVTALTAFGFEGAVAMSHAMIGLPGVECQQLLRAHYGAAFPLADFNRAFAATCDDLLREGMPLKPGAIELLDALRAADCPMAIVTSSSRRTADRHLTLGGIRSRFSTILTRDDVARGKPSPDLYLLAADALGVAPNRCIAIEDSNPGIAAAHSAGTIPIMVPDLLEPSAETRSKCAAVLPDLHAALALLRQRGGLGAVGQLTSAPHVVSRQPRNK
jgi:HAD superfamily hydrolase (TIGR01509 family)